MKVFKMQSLSKLTGLMVFTLLGSFIFYLYGCKDNPTGPKDEGNNDPGTPRTSVPAQLVAEWFTGTISSIDFYNPNNGVWGAPSGTGIFFKFYSDGYYEKGVLLQSSLYNCTMTFFAYNKGTMTVEGDKIVLYPTYGRIKSEDNCVQENNYEKADQLESETIFWELGQDEYGNEVLWLRYETSNPSAFYQR